ncbi:MAG: type II toxin-antitoxin system RelE/ParE family toxin [bacterium]|nr:type II toxin-antitoxin system RelE/ParE family toxin [Alphaproteobacteria bacterium]MDI1364986.1 type II toxin-antitoxin system RelE/ParE family toxin [bacterium]
MSYAVSVSARAQKDVRRLDVQLSAHSPRAAARLGLLLEKALDSLVEAPMRGRLIGGTVREINIPFGRSAYVIRYRVSGSRVIITRIWHGLEDRQP